METKTVEIKMVQITEILTGDKRMGILMEATIQEIKMAIKAVI